MSTLKEKNLLPKEQILSLKSRPYFERAVFSRKANRKSQKLFPFEKMIENHRGVLIYLTFLTVVDENYKTFLISFTNFNTSFARFLQ